MQDAVVLCSTAARSQVAASQHAVSYRLQTQIVSSQREIMGNKERLNQACCCLFYWVQTEYSIELSVLVRSFEQKNNKYTDSSSYRQQAAASGSSSVNSNSSVISIFYHYLSRYKIQHHTVLHVLY